MTAAIATMATPALLVLGAGTALATPDISARGAAGTSADLPTARMCPSCDGSNPEPDPPDYPDLGSGVGLGGRDTKVGIGSPEERPLNPGTTVGIIIEGS